MSHISEPSVSTNRKGVQRMKKKLVRVDLTPMVDLGFLLISFFVFTTTLSQPRVMQLIDPKGDIPAPVKASGSMVILLSGDNVGYYYGLPDTAVIHRAPFASLRPLLLQHQRNSKPGELMYLLKADSTATFGRMIDLVDELVIANVPPGHFAEADLLPEERKWILQQH